MSNRETNIRSVLFLVIGILLLLSLVVCIYIVSSESDLKETKALVKNVKKDADGTGKNDITVEYEVDGVPYRYNFYYNKDVNEGETVDIFYHEKNNTSVTTYKTSKLIFICPLIGLGLCIMGLFELFKKSDDGEEEFKTSVIGVVGNTQQLKIVTDDETIQEYVKTPEEEVEAQVKSIKKDAELLMQNVESIDESKPEEYSVPNLQLVPEIRIVRDEKENDEKPNDDSFVTPPKSTVSAGASTPTALLKELDKVTNVEQDLPEMKKEEPTEETKEEIVKKVDKDEKVDENKEKESTSVEKEIADKKDSDKEKEKVDNKSSAEKEESDDKNTKTEESKEEKNKENDDSEEVKQSEKAVKNEKDEEVKETEEKEDTSKEQELEDKKEKVPTMKEEDLPELASKKVKEQDSKKKELKVEETKEEEKKEEKSDSEDNKEEVPKEKADSKDNKEDIEEKKESKNSEEETTKNSDSADNDKDSEKDVDLEKAKENVASKADEKIESKDDEDKKESSDKDIDEEMIKKVKESIKKNDSSLEDDEIKKVIKNVLKEVIQEVQVEKEPEKKVEQKRVLPNYYYISGTSLIYEEPGKESKELNLKTIKSVVRTVNSAGRVVKLVVSSDEVKCILTNMKNIDLEQVANLLQNKMHAIDENFKEVIENKEY